MRGRGGTRERKGEGNVTDERERELQVRGRGGTRERKGEGNVTDEREGGFRWGGREGWLQVREREVSRWEVQVR